MKIAPLHEWRLNPAQAVALQQQLRSRLILEGAVEKMERVAGADVAFEEGGRVAHGVVVVLSVPGFHILEVVEERQPVTFPYIPGLLSFRESPVLLICFERLCSVPDVVLVDGQGIAHPRRFGIASHLGLWLDLPTVGVAKSRLTGTHPQAPDQPGATVPLTDHGEEIGVVLRSRPGTQPIYISPGHRIGLLQAVRVVQACLNGYRLPEPTRIADRHSKGVEETASTSQQDLFA